MAEMFGRTAASAEALLALFLVLLSVLHVNSDTVAAGGQQKRSKVVSTLLNAKWSRTPFVLEAAEFLAEENSDYFWAFLDYLAESDNVDMEAKLKDEELYSRVITFASR